MLINLRNREGKLIVKDVLDIDFDMSVEEENNKYVISNCSEPLIFWESIL